MQFCTVIYFLNLLVWIQKIKTNVEVMFLIDERQLLLITWPFRPESQVSSCFDYHKLFKVDKLSNPSEYSFLPM